MTTTTNLTLADVLTRWLVYELQGPGFAWEVGTARYRDRATGRFISEDRVSRLMTDITDKETPARIARITEMRNNGTITTSTWRRQMAQEIKIDHINNAMAGRGGHDAMSQADWGRQGGRLKQQYQHLNNFAKEIEAGDLSEAQINARAKMYANAGRTGYYDGAAAAHKAAGHDQERRVLNPAEHCQQCKDWAAEGWQKINHFPPPGIGSPCMTNCRCHKEYRNQLMSIAEDISEDPFTDIRPPAGRAPRGKGKEYEQRRHIVSRIETHQRWRSIAQEKLSQYRGQTGTRARWRIDTAKERVRQLDTAIEGMMNLATDKYAQQDWGFVDEMTKGIAGYTSDLRKASA